MFERDSRCSMCEYDDHQCFSCALWDEKQESLREEHSDEEESDYAVYEKENPR